MRCTAVLSRYRHLLTSGESFGKFIEPKIIELREQLKIKYIPLLQQKDAVSPKLLEEMREYVINSNNNSAMTDGIILDTLKQCNCTNAGLSYYNFLKSNQHDLPIYTVCKYMELYINKKDPLSAIEKDHIHTLCNDIIKQYLSYDKYTTLVLVQSLCRIDKWKEAVEVMNNFEKYDKDALHIAYNDIVTYLLNSNQGKVAYEFLNNLLAREITISPKAYNAYFEFCLRDKHSFVENIEKLLMLWSKYAIKPWVPIMKKFVNMCKEADLPAKFSSIKKNKCMLCNQDLSNEDITEEEHKQLYNALRRKLLIEKMHQSNESSEIDNFMRFIRNKGPYDVVIDGLNALYIVPGSNTLIKLIINIQRKNIKALLIARKHVQKHSRLKGLLKHLDYFFVDDASNDDLFILYAALSSKKNTKLITSDMMRNHEFSLTEVELKANFKKWQILNQYTQVDFMNNTQAKQAVDAVVQKNGSYWHIPYMVTNGTLGRRHTSDCNWICLNICP